MRKPAQPKIADVKSMRRRKALRKQTERQQLAQFGRLQNLPWHWIHGVLYDCRGRQLDRESDRARGLGDLERSGQSLDFLGGLNRSFEPSVRSFATTRVQPPAHYEYPETIIYRHRQG